MASETSLCSLASSIRARPLVMKKASRAEQAPTAP
jgi:hypothetical protein